MITDTITNATGYSTYSPAVDYTGTALPNLVLNELHSIGNDGGSAYCYIVPHYSPFYANSVVVNSFANGVITGTLTVGVDYVFAFPFIGASRATGYSVFGGIKFTNPNFIGQVVLRYQTLGGTWITGAAVNSTIMNSPIVTNDPQVITWEQVANYKSNFPIVTIPWDKADTAELSAVNYAIETMRANLTTNLMSMDLSAQIAHLTNFSNPHNDTAATVGLGNVVNLPAATQMQANDPNNNTSYISAAEVANTFSSSADQATTSYVGATTLNGGVYGGDSTDSTKALTAAGLVTLLAEQPNSLGGVVNRVQGIAQITPWALPASFTWRGTRYSDIHTFMAAVAAVANVSALEYSTVTGTVWFPPNVAVLSLATGA